MGDFDQMLLGAVRRGEMGKVLEVATSFLNWQDPYWNTFCHPEHLAGWLLTNFCCPYCETDLLEEHIPANRAHTDHLLPKSKYPALCDHSMMNAVASCDTCNCLKGDWDPNAEEPIYVDGDLTFEVRVLLIERAKAHLDSIRKPKIDRQSKIAKIRLAAAQAREKLK
jgi:hypothetical protein